MLKSHEQEYMRSTVPEVVFHMASEYDRKHVGDASKSTPCGPYFFTIGQCPASGSGETSGQLWVGRDLHLPEDDEKLLDSPNTNYSSLWLF